MCRRSRVSQQCRILAWFTIAWQYKGESNERRSSKIGVRRALDSHSAAFQTDVYVIDDKILITRTGEYRVCGGGKKRGARNICRKLFRAVVSRSHSRKANTLKFASCTFYRRPDHFVIEFLILRLIFTRAPTFDLHLSVFARSLKA